MDARHTFNRLRELGIRNSAKIINNKVRNKLFYMRWRSHAVERTAQHTWQLIAHKYGIDESFFKYLKSRQALQLVQGSRDDNWYFTSSLIAQANAHTRNQFDILGSGPQTFTKLPWHEDIRLKAQNPDADCQFDAYSFYKDIKIETGTADIIKDIKVPWELSRCQHLPILGQAFQITNDSLYAQTFVLHTSSWLDHNPYLLGINWLCPMEVAIRAINWIWAWNYFKQSCDITPEFWERFTCSLYDHMHYLENNWEIFDTKTSNHYLSDLLGYLYLCWFFQDFPGIHKKRDWCVKELLKEFERQVFQEGTDYESTTAYHCLVTEIFDHMALVCKAMNIPLPTSFHATLDRMHEFIAWCTINDHEMVKIGDDDSGGVTLFRPIAPSSFVTFFVNTKNTQDERGESIIHPSISDEQILNNKDTNCGNAHPAVPSVALCVGRECFCESKNVTKDRKGSTGIRDNYKHFPSFGLSILKTKRWHVTLRHHAYTKQQPSAHFHNDALSITLAIDGIPILIDPGSYLYTASSQWRNHFRSVSVHNTFYVQGHEPIPFDDRLFALNIPEQKINLPFTFSSSHNLYSRFNLTLHRTLDWDNQKIMITDSWTEPSEDFTLGWNFTLHPDIQIEQSDNRWILSYNNKPLIALETTLNFQSHATWISPEYGVKVPSLSLKATYSARLGNESKIVFIKL